MFDIRESTLLADRALVVGSGADAAMLAGAGYEIADIVPIEGAEARMAQQVAADLVLLRGAGVDAGRIAPLAVALYETALDLGAAMIVELSRDGLDAASALIGEPGVQILCEPSDGERLAALLLARRHEAGDRLGDSSREAERLRQLNSEVARIAEVLAKLTRDDRDAGASGFGDRSVGYDAPPAGTGPYVAASGVRALIRARRMRDRFFDATLFSDPAWDMLLDLFAAELEHVRVSVSSLCIAAAVPATTALRWIGSMTESGLFERRPDPFDKRRAFIGLSTNAGLAMRRYFAAIGEAELPGG